jgi:hypothetical protein
MPRFMRFTILTVLVLAGAGLLPPILPAQEGFRPVTGENIYYLLNNRAIAYENGACEFYTLALADPYGIGALADGGVDFYENGQASDDAMLTVYKDQPDVLEVNFYDLWADTYRVYENGTQVKFVDTDTGEEYIGLILQGGCP